jgi:hypothetical protein
MAALPAHSCLADSEAIICDVKGLSVFDLIRFGHYRFYNELNFR